MKILEDASTGVTQSCAATVAFKQTLKMRIIAGKAKGMALKTPASITRPTMDRVRAAIFSMLGDRVPDARVADFFAGTGAMGIEALSRGAATALFVDQDRKSTEVIRQNLLLTKFQGEVKQHDVLQFLKHLPPSATFDLIFADPPYAKKEGLDLATALLQAPELLSAMAEDALLILECEKKQQLPEIPNLEVLIDRIYGITRIVIFRKKILPS